MSDSSPTMAPLLEVACFNPSSAISAIRAGADRIEFCTSYSSGGLTPDPSELRAILPEARAYGVPVNVMIKLIPGHDYTLDDDHMLRRLRTYIKLAKTFPGVTGFVFGFLDAEGNIDSDRNWELVKTAFPKPCTFHRAFDHARGDLYSKLESVRRCGFTTILTSGCVGPATEGTQRLKMLVDFARQMDIEVLVGGGVRESNLAMLMEQTGATSFHTSALKEGVSIQGHEWLIPECDAIMEMKKMLVSRYPAAAKSVM